MAQLISYWWIGHKYYKISIFIGTKMRSRMNGEHLIHISTFNHSYDYFTGSIYDWSLCAHSNISHNTNSKLYLHRNGTVRIPFMAAHNTIYKFIFFSIFFFLIIFHYYVRTKKQFASISHIHTVELHSPNSTCLMDSMTERRAIL